MALALGGVLFTGFEAPERINFGGRQALVTHKLPGGERVVDAMGPDDDEIAWQGRFRGGLAAFRARSVDAFRAAGTPVTLAWGGFRHTVLVAEFKADYRQAYEIPYTVSCLVVPPPPRAAPAGLADLVGTDLAAALSLGVTGIAALGTVQAAVAAAKSLKDGFRGGAGGVEAAVTAAQAALGQAAGVADAVLAAAGRPTTDAAGFAAGLLAQADAAAELDTLYRAAASLGRMATNLKSLGG